ncbi:UNVERIFIED_CONTAM: hypothetical protein FKN15_002143 [Acipenser sinensis]
MATFISVPLKKSSEVDLVKPLTKFISATYSAAEDQGEYVRAAEELNKLRKSAVGRPLDKHESSLEVLLRYYDQLCAIEPKFPFSENQLCLTFTWKDAFDKGSLFGGSVKLALASLGYEKSCVLFNIGALASQIAYEQNFDNDEGLKTAAKYYQLASGAFSYIKDTVLSALNREPTMDISPDAVGALSQIMLAQAQELASGAFSYIKDTVLSALNREPTMDISPDAVGALSQIMLAQAQEVFFLKATSDKMKDAIIARLANQAADFYGDAFKQCQYKENLPKHATELIKTVASRYDEYINVKDLSDKISRALTAAKKDNDFIYHDRVPDLKDLEAIGKAALVKSTVIKVPISQKFTDLFEKMVPLAVQHSMSVYNSRKAEIVNRLIGQMREATNLSNGVLASLNLPAAVEDLSGDSIPQSILEKSRAIIQQGGLQSIDQLIKDLPELLQRNREILDESVRILDEEEATDNELRNKFGQRWQRTASNDLYKPLRTEGGNLCKFLDQAVQADKVVKERYSTHRDMIALLCKPEAELNAAIPSANPAKTLQGSENSHQEFSTMKQSNADANQREEMLKKLAAAHDSYVELSNNLREGTKFYNELTEILLKFQNKCSDIVFARKTERDELLKDLQQNIARQPSAPSFPAVPAYQSTPSSTTTPATATSSVPTPAPRTVFQSKPQPPARPPPPAIQAQAANTSTPPVSGAGPFPPATQPVSTPGATPSPAQGPPYPTYQGYPGCYQMPVAYNPYAYGQYNMPYMYQAPGQAPYPNVQHPQQPGYQYPQQPYYPQQ